MGLERLEQDGEKARTCRGPGEGWKGRPTAQRTMETQPRLGTLWLPPQYARKTDLGVGMGSWCHKQKLSRCSSLNEY